MSPPSPTGPAANGPTETLAETSAAGGREPLESGATRGARPYVIGLSHRIAPPEVRDRLGGEAADLPAGLETLRSAGLQAAVLLATCDRVEVCGMAVDPEEEGRRGLSALARRAAMDPDALLAEAYRLVDDDAVAHLFAVAASLESQVIGEPQVLGQVRAALQAARDHDLVPPALGDLFEAALAAGKRVRSETTIGERPVSIASAALQTARDLHGDLRDCRGVLYGTGEMGEMLARQFIAAGIGHLTVAHSSGARAERLARELGVNHAAVDEAGNGDAEPIEALLATADILVCAVGTGRMRIQAAPVRRALRKRRYKPILLVDSAVPGDIDPAVGKLGDAFHYTLEDLERLATEGRAGRRAELDAAQAVLSEEMAGWRRRNAERSGAPSIVALRQHFDSVRREVMAELGRGGSAIDADRATSLLVARLLHTPTVALRASMHRDTGQNLSQAVATLFGLQRDVERPERTDDEEKTG